MKKFLLIIVVISYVVQFAVPQSRIDWEPGNGRYLVSAVAQFPGTEMAVIGNTNGEIYLTFDALNLKPKWFRLGNNTQMPGSMITSIAINPNNIQEFYVTFAGIKQGTKLYKTENMGASFTPVDIPYVNLWSVSVNPIDGSIVYVIAEGRVVVSTDHGETWTTEPIQDVLTPPIKGEARISAVACSVVDLEHIIVGTTDGQVFICIDIYSETPNWLRIDDQSRPQAIDLPDRIVTKACCDHRTNPPVYYVSLGHLISEAFEDNLYRNLGEVWQDIHNPNLPGTIMTGIHINPAFYDVLYTGYFLTGGTAYSEDGGKSWQTAILGDVNDNGSIDIVDALILAQYYVGLNPPSFISGVADVNHDNSINILDALLIARYYVGLFPLFNYSEPHIWPMAGYDVNRSGHCPYPSINNPASKWIYNTGNTVRSTALVALDGTIYLCSGNGDLNAINPDGSLKWSYQISDSIYSSPAIGNDGVVFTGGSLGVYAINPDSTLKWFSDVTSSSWTCESSCAIDDDGTIYIGSSNSNLYAINPDGTVKWSYLTEGRIYTSPAIGPDGTIYIGSEDYNLYAISNNGTLKWTFNTTWSPSSPVVGPDGTIYIGAGTVLYAINADGTQRWYQNYGNWGSHPYLSPGIHSDGTLYVGSEGALSAINPENGSTVWTCNIPGNIYCSPAITLDGTVYVCSEVKYDCITYPYSGSCTYDYSINAINSDGTIRWSYQYSTRSGGPESIYSLPVINEDGTIYIGSLDGNLYSIGEM